MYVGWTYEIDAEAELIYVGYVPPEALRNHNWTYPEDPYITYKGRGGIKDFFCDFRYQKVLEITDANTTRCIPVTCTVRDMRFPQMVVEDTDDDPVCFEIGNITFHPDDLRCVKLQDVTMFESGEVFHVFAEVEKGKITPYCPLKLESITDTDIYKFSKLVYGWDSATDTYHVVSYLAEMFNAIYYVDTDPYKFTNQFRNSDNNEFFRRVVNYKRKSNKPVAIIFDNAIDSGDLSPQDDDSNVGMRAFFISTLGALGEGWDIVHHNKLTAEDCASGVFWDNYDTFIYVDRNLIGAKLPDLVRVLELTARGDSRLLVLGSGINAFTLAQASTVEREPQKRSLTSQNFKAGESDPHSVSAGLSLHSPSPKLIGWYNSADIDNVSKEYLDIELVDDHLQIVPSDNVSMVHAVLKLTDNNRFHRTRRQYRLSIDEEKGYGIETTTECAKNSCVITLIDDDVQEDVDKSLNVYNVHRILEPFTTYERFHFKANTWYEWDNSLYKDVSSNIFHYTLGFLHCGVAAREVHAELMITNNSDQYLTVNAFGQGDTIIKPHNMNEYESSMTREFVNLGYGYFDPVKVFSAMDVQQDWKMLFRFVDFRQCDDEPPPPVYCSSTWNVQAGQRIGITDFADRITEGCNEFTGHFNVKQCGDPRNCVVEFKFGNPEPRGAQLTIKDVSGKFHKQYIPANSEVVASMDCTYPVNINEDEYYWIAKVELVCDRDDVLPNLTCEVLVKDVEICSWLPEGMECSTTDYDGLECTEQGISVAACPHCFESSIDQCLHYYKNSLLNVGYLDLDDANVRYRVQISVETKTNGNYTLKAVGRGKGDVLLWSGSNATTWESSYYLNFSDFTSQDARSREKYLMSYSGDLYSDFTVCVNFVRQCYIAGTWIDNCNPNLDYCTSRPTIDESARELVTTSRPWAGLDIGFSHGSGCPVEGGLVVGGQDIRVYNLSLDTNTPVTYCRIILEGKGEGWITELYRADRLPVDPNNYTYTKIIEINGTGKKTHISKSHYLDYPTFGKGDAYVLKARSTGSPVFNPFSCTGTIAYQAFRPGEDLQTCSGDILVSGDHSLGSYNTPMTPRYCYAEFAHPKKCVPSIAENYRMTITNIDIGSRGADFYVEAECIGDGWEFSVWRRATTSPYNEYMWIGWAYSDSSIRTDDMRLYDGIYDDTQPNLKTEHIFVKIRKRESNPYVVELPTITLRGYVHKSV